MPIVMLDLELGFCYYGSTLVKLLNVGVTQGSNLSPGLYDCTLEIVEHSNSEVVTF